MNGGWFSISRKMFENPIFRGRADRMGVWVWLVGNAAYQDCQQDVGGKTVMIRRGQLCASQAMICKETGVSRQDLRSLLMALTRSGAICVESVQNLTKGRTIITICNYEKYQQAPQAANQAATKQQPTKEQGNNSDTNVSGAEAPADPIKVMFDFGIRLLTAASVSERQARSLLGRWKGQHGVEAVLVALGKAQREGAIDPVAFIEGCFRHSGQTKSNYRHEGDRIEYADAFGGGPVWR